MTYGVDAPVNRPHSLARKPVSNRMAVYTGTEELRPRNDAMLPIRQVGDDPVHMSGQLFAPHGRLNRG